MGMPFNMQNCMGNLNLGTYRPQIYDLCSGTMSSSWNLFLNQMESHRATWPGICSVPYTNYSYTPYNDNIFTPNWMLDPKYTIASLSWGTPAWGQLNNGKGGWDFLGFSLGSGSSSSSSSSSSDPNAEKFKPKYNKLLALVKQLSDYQHIDDDSKGELNVAIKNTKGTYEERYNRLKEAYEKVDKEIVREFLVEGGHNLYTKDVDGLSSSDKEKYSLYSRLLGTGYDYNDTKVDLVHVADFDDGLQTLSNKTGRAEKAEGVIGLINTGSIDILDFISSWNNYHAGDEESSRVIDYISQCFDDIDADDLRETAIANSLRPFVRALITKANSVKNSLNGESKDRLVDAIKNVEESLNNSDTSIDENLSAAFDELYLITRQAAVAKLNNDVKSYYGGIDEEVFDGNLFVDDTIDDLRTEGFSLEEIEASSVQVSTKRERRAGRRSSSSEESGSGSGSKSSVKVDELSLEEKIAYLKEQNCIKEKSIKKDGTITVYEEVNKSGDSDGDGTADYARLFYIDTNGNFVEWKNTKVNSSGTGYEAINPSDVQESVVVKASDIVDATKNLEKTKKAKEKEAEKAAEAYNPESAGCSVAKSLYTFAGESQQKRAAANLSKKDLNSKNIIQFLNGYYSVNPLGSQEGIIERLDDHGGESITKEMKKNIIESLLSYAKENGKTSSQAYKDLNTVYNEWKKSYPGASDFNQTYENDAWYINWITASWTNYNEKLDECIEALYQDLK